MSDARQVSGRRSRALSHHASANDLWGGNAHEFFGADRIEIPDDASYDSTDAITVEVWVKADAWASRATNLRKNSSFILYNYSGGYSWYTYGPNHWQQYDIAGELGTGAWGHIVGTYEKDEGADNKQLWLNGAIKISQTVTGALEAGASDMGIGEEISGTADPFDGLIDEIRISTTKRSDASITATYRNLSDPVSFLSPAARRRKTEAPRRRRAGPSLRPSPAEEETGGSHVADLAAWQAQNFPDGQGQAIAEFLDADGALLGTIATSLQHVGTGGWVEVTASGAVPAGARQVRIKLRAVLVAGSVPNVAFDGISLIIQEQEGGGGGGQSAGLVVVAI